MQKAINRLDKIQIKIVDLLTEGKITKEEYNEMAENIHQVIKTLESPPSCRKFRQPNL